ncbi:MAG: peroxiredoxin [Gammaproteobacteria bacterium]|nr:peroxiredoxin [Gammaproteobacteria bacterium]MBT8444165.1 peroxiredoxin [Gammaproteobacteria bacterium]NND36226.1 peroxiredoxin [Gammaproteobacteria bacterium]
MIRTTGKLLGGVMVALMLTAASAAPLEVGKTAPDFRLQDQKGDWHSLEQYRGQWVVLYFYPKDDTPGCTKEACGFRDNIFAFEDMGAVILGVSLDDVESHQAFAEKYSLPFSLLSDADAKTAGDYGVLNKLATFRYAKRESFIIDPDGKVAKHYAKVDAERHSKRVLADLQVLMKPAA